MINVIVELSKYVILTLMIIYTFHCFYTVRHHDRKSALGQQLMLIFFMDFVAFLVIFLKTQNLQVIRFYLEMMAFFVILQILYHIFYKQASFLLLNNMCMLLSVGFIILCRLNIATATRQLLIAAGGSAVALVIPVLIRKMKFLRYLTWVYAAFGIILLAAVFVLGKTSYGAKLSLMGVQPSEAIKITFVFFMASILAGGRDFRTVVLATIVAGLHVLILVASVDLGSAVIFFVAYLVMIYVGTRNPGYLALGVGGGCGASVVAYYLFGHVRQRVSAWRDPMSVYESEGYQVVQSLFAIGTGGWFGMGLCQGSPNMIPIVTNDFIFSAICEELGGVFAICLILVCMSFFLMIVNIALQIKSRFYKLIALGLGVEYAFQVFLTVGGATKFIPLTGVTLPLVSYGGSSMMSTLILLAIIQGLYILREDEDIEIERRKKEAAQRKRENEQRDAARAEARRKGFD
jgi:cell division protein FtsW (lipid II flippase)